MDEAVVAQFIAPFFGFDKSNPYGFSVRRRGAIHCARNVWGHAGGPDSLLKRSGSPYGLSGSEGQEARIQTHIQPLALL